MAVPVDLLDAAASDPPPPYPAQDRRHRPRTSRRRTHALPATRSARSSPDDALSPTLHILAAPSETTPLLHPRRRADSHASTVVSSGSFAHTVLSLCHDSDNESDVDAADQHPPDVVPPRPSAHRRAWATYFRPLGRKAYHAAVFHLMVVNFPFALIAWIYLFVFTLTGTTLLITLPLGALLCFLDLLGARIFARGELALQTKFHGPLAYPPPYPPRPIFQRVRPTDDSAAEAGTSGEQFETSFYKNAYAMFTDGTTYQALFYFLVVKPSITLCISLALVVLVPVSYALVLPAPLMLRVVRRVGVWQANVAVEGLYYQVA